jgi:hypothetical protein
MRKYKILILLTCLLPSFMSCRPDHTYVLFSIKNNSDKSIYFTYSNLYPDTAVDTSIYIPPGSTRTPGEVIYPGQTYPENAFISLNSYFGSVPSDTIEIFIYDANLVQTTPWDSVVANYLVLKRYDLSLQDIDKMNGVISYP